MSRGTNCRVVAVGVLLGVWIAGAGCSSCEGGRVTVTDGWSEGRGDADVVVDGRGGGEDGGEVGGDVAETETGDCPSERRCGSSCCSGDESCVDGACLPPCEGKRCGEANRQCCTGDEICLYDGCVKPGEACRHSRQCPDGKICQRKLGRCVPEPDVDCTYRPDTQAFDPEVSLAWRAGDETPAASYNQVMMTPTVADVDGSGTPNIVFSTFEGGSYNAASVIRIIDGETYEPVAHLTESAKRVAGSATIAIGDIDTDGENELVGVQPESDGLVALDDHTTGWEVLWRQGGFDMSWDSASLVDLNADGAVEVVAANRVLDGETGEVHCVAGGLSSTARNSTAADLDGDGDQEVVAANGAFEFESDGAGGYKCSTMYSWSEGAGYPAVADFGTYTADRAEPGALDGKPEVAVVGGSSGGTVHLYDGQSGEHVWSSSIPNDGHPNFERSRCRQGGAGPPTAADFDGDDVPEVATAGACYYAVFETDGSLLWRHPSQDFSSSQTGSSVFDFQGDGRAEAVYADECFVRVYDGSGNGDGTTDVYFERPHSSGTTRELPVVADVDGDFNTEIVAISNDYSGVGNSCRSDWEAYPESGGPERGILVLEDRQNRWVPSRRIWNQHAYHVTNVCGGANDDLCPGRTDEAGAIPKGQRASWEVDYLNSFRQNVQGEGVFDAPDLAVGSIELANVSCGEAGVGAEIAVEVVNRGARGVAAGTRVAVEVSTDGSSWSRVGSAQTTRLLLPGQSEVVRVSWDVPSNRETAALTFRATADSDEEVNECKEGNNRDQFEVSSLLERAPAPEIEGLSLEDSQCGTARRVTVEIDLANPGGSSVPGGLPVELRAKHEGDSWEVGTPTTGRPLESGATIELSQQWSVPQTLIGEEFEIEAEVDPSGEVTACASGTATATGDCEITG